MIKKIKSFYLYMLGKPEEFSLEERIILGIIYLSTFAYIIGLFTSIIQKNPIISGVFILYIFLMLSFIYLARFKKKFYFFLGITLTIIPLCILWFFNGGISGGTPFLFIFPIIISPLIGKKFDKILVIIVSALAMISLLTVEYFIPNTIFQHKSRELRFIDLFTSYMISCGVIFFIVQKVVKEYQTQKDFLEMKTYELRKANEMLLRTQEKLIQTEKLATLGVIAGGIAHELNSPLASISMTTQLIEIELESVDNNELKESLKESLTLIKEGAKKSGIIVKDFYDYVEKHKSELNLSSEAEYDLYVKGDALKNLVDSLINKKDEEGTKKSSKYNEKDN